jgi:BppU N-terminal domain
MTIQLKRNDTKDIISYTLTNLDGSVVNLTGATVRFMMGKGKNLVTNASATITNAATGQVQYTMSESDTLLSGIFNAEFEVTFSNGKVKTYPSDGYIMVKIQANIDKDQSTYIEDQIAYRVSDIQVLKNSIQAQLDQFAKDATNAETSQARVEADGTTNATLKARLDKKEAEFKTFKDSTTSSLAQKAKEYRIDVTKYGTVGDGLTDDKQKILNAITDCIALVGINKIPTLYFPYCDGYAVTGTITVPAGISVIMDAPLRYRGTLNEPCLIIGETAKTNSNVKLILQSVRNTLSDWTNESSIGIKLINTLESEITIIQSRNYTIGVQFQGDTKGFVYNEVKLFSLSGNKFCIDLTSKSSGWTNENNFYGGRFSNFSGQNTGKSRYGVRITSEDGYIQNNNVFYKPSFELNSSVAAPEEALPILIERGSQNTFIGCRSEGNTATVARVLNDSTENKIHVGFGSQNTKVEDQSTYPASLLEVNRRQTIDRDGKVVFLAHNVHKRACYYNGTTQVNVPGVFNTSSVNENVFKYGTGHVINANYLELGTARGLGIFVDTRTAKRFLIRRDVLLGNEGRVAIRCYDVNGNILTNAGANHPYVKSMAYSSFSYITSYGGIYQNGSDTQDDLYINLHQDVAKIAILLLNGTNLCRVKGFGVYSLDNGHATVSLGYEEIIPGVNLGTTYPTVGTWEKGRVILNDNKTILGVTGSQYVVEGWECLTAGTPGTWIEKRMYTGT